MRLGWTLSALEKRLNVTRCAQGCARRAQIRRTVIWEDVLRLLKPGGPCLPTALDKRTSGADALANAGTETAMDVATESRAVPLARTDGVPVVWS
jgi:hypothetical protein